MRKFNVTVLVLLAVITLPDCGNKSSSAFPMQKKYWTPDDYETVNEELTSLKYNNKELPNLDNPNSRDIFTKIVDTNNFSIVANDSQLGLKYRKEMTSKFFDEWKQMVGDYDGQDRSDKFQYPLELVEIHKFGLALQVYYIQTTNQNIIKTADDPNSAEVTDITRRNKNTLIRNYSLYLELIKYEDRFNDKALASYTEGLGAYFPKLINVAAPDGDYAEMLVTIDNMIKKSKNASIVSQLQNIRKLITDNSTDQKQL